MNGCNQPQCLVDQRPAFDKKRRQRGRRESQVVGKGGIIRQDKRKRTGYVT